LVRSAIHNGWRNALHITVETTQKGIQWRNALHITVETTQKGIQLQIILVLYF